jgi:succinyl-diaminopimelate desuccinylase
MNNQLIKDLEQIISFKSTSDNPKAMDECFEYIKTRLSQLPFELEEFSSNGKKSILWKSKPGKINILLNAHIDVVPGSDEMFTLKEKKETFIGRGVSDMKFTIPIFISVLNELFAEKKDISGIHLLITSDEETGGKNGAGYFVQNNKIDYDLVITPDGGENWDIVEKAKGVLQVQLTAKGKSAHGSRPWEGKSAIDMILNDLLELRKIFPEETTEAWKTTLTIGQIKGGEQTNQVSPFCQTMLDVRYIPEDGKEKIKKIITDTCKNSLVEYISEADPFFTDKYSNFISKWNDLLNSKNIKHNFVNAHGASDGRYFSKLGIPVLICKPTGGFIHSEREWLNKASFGVYALVLKEYLSCLIRF